MSVYPSNKDSFREDILSNPPFTRPVRPATCACAVVPKSVNLKAVNAKRNRHDRSASPAR